VKLVRDLIPTIIEESGKSCTYHIVEDDELQERLYEKMREELDEFVENPCLEEAADMWEVLHAIFEVHGIHHRDVMNKAKDKEEERGGFTKGIVLEKVINEGR